MKRGTVLFSLLFICVFLIAQKDSLQYFPGQLSVLYPLGTSGSQSINQKYTASFNLFHGLTGAVEGVEFSCFVKTNKYYMQGAQFAGIANITGSYVDGVQFGGICNIAGASVTGGQFAGIANITADDLDGFQAAGIANLADSAIGGQFAGIANRASDMDGFQVAGIGNLSEGRVHAQAAGISNIAKSVDGIQVAGISNVAGYVKGVQLAGIVNICDSIDGVPLALISIVRYNGYRRFEVWSSEVFHANISYKIGVEALYTSINLGYKVGDQDNNTGIGFGIGTHKDLGVNSGIDLELLSYHISRHLWMDENNYMHTIKLSYEYRFGDRLALFAGPTLNMLQSDPESDAYELAPDYGVEYSNFYDWKYWIGFNAGIRF